MMRPLSPPAALDALVLGRAQAEFHRVHGQAARAATNRGTKSWRVPNFREFQGLVTCRQSSNPLEAAQDLSSFERWAFGLSLTLHGAHQVLTLTARFWLP